MTANGYHTRPDPDPLDMATRCIAAVEQYAQHVEDDPVGAHIAKSGAKAHQTATLAALTAIVAIAGDIRRIADRIDHP